MFCWIVIYPQVGSVEQTAELFLGSRGELANRLPPGVMPSDLTWSSISVSFFTSCSCFSSDSISFFPSSSLKKNGKIQSLEYIKKDKSCLLGGEVPASWYILAPSWALPCLPCSLNEFITAELKEVHTRSWPASSQQQKTSPLLWLSSEKGICLFTEPQGAAHLQVRNRDASPKLVTWYVNPKRRGAQTEQRGWGWKGQRTRTQELLFLKAWHGPGGDVNPIGEQEEPYHWVTVSAFRAKISL